MVYEEALRFHPEKKVKKDRKKFDKILEKNVA